MRIGDVAEELNDAIDRGESVMVESTQGFGLSLVHSGCYPYTTSRDLTPGIILNDAGLSSRIGHQVIAVVRTQPIRVAGNSGPMVDESSWAEEMAKNPTIEAPERTTVTNNPRRIAAGQDWHILNRMVRLCRPDAIALSFLDYLDPSVYGVSSHWDLPKSVKSELVRYWDRLGVPVRYFSTAPGVIGQW